MRHAQFAALFDGALDAVLIATDTRHYVDANPAACALLGLSRQEIISRRVEDFGSPDQHDLVERSWQMFLEQGEQQGEWRLVLPDGTTRDVEYKARANFAPGYHLSILRDVTERKLAEAALRAGQVRWSTLVEAIPQQVWTAHPDGALDYVNQRILDYCGYSFDEIIGQGWQRIIHPDDLEDCAVRWTASLATGAPYEVEFRLRRGSDGAYRCHIGRALPLHDEEGRITKWFGTNTDITEIKQVEEERVRVLEQEQAARAQAEAANRAKDEFMALVSHELRTPLQAILGWTQLLRTGELDQVAANHAIDVIERSARSQAKLVEDILDISRAISGKLSLNIEPVELMPVVEEAVDAMRPAAEARGIDLRFLHDTETAIVPIDPHRLRQVLWNLISNALKFTPRGGLVEVKLVKTESDMEIVVRDNGQGISSEFLPYVFDRFRQAENANQGTENGLGLGLAIVRHIVEMHGGTVWVESPGSGLGSTFTVRLSAHPAHLGRVKEPMPLSQIVAS